MTHRLTRVLRLVFARARRLWRLAGSRVCAYRLRTDDETRLVERVIDVQVLGDHVFLTDIDGRVYLVELAFVRCLAPVDFRGARRLPRPIPVAA
ncbi:MAG: hypothetical protein VW405_02320 [Rhodospirillaceae bacterium]